MTSGLRWWHEVCAEVRESGRVWSRRDYEDHGAEAVVSADFADEQVRDVFMDCYRKFPSQNHLKLSNQARDFLRTAWLSAYRKARNGK
jgi:hypothetical protein